MEYTSTDYEIFAQRLHQKLIDDQGFEGINVEHNTKLVGKSGALHQIDVYWKIELAGIEQQFCVECKRWKGKVKKEHISAFHGKLMDLNCAKGIFVTTNGYQEGAVKFAEQYGIVLVSTDVEVSEGSATLEFSNPVLSDLEIIFSESDEAIYNWIRKHSETGSKLSAEEIDIFSSTMEKTGKLIDLIDCEELDDDGHYSCDFQDEYINMDGRYVKIASISFNFLRNRFPELTLNADYEEVTIAAKYVIDGKNILEKIILQNK